MFKTGKCPSCGEVPNFGVELQAVDVKTSAGRTFHGVMYVCPNAQCHSILGVGLDPLAVKTDIVDAVVKALREKR